MHTVAFDGTPLFRNPDGVGRYTTQLISHFAKNNPDWNIIIIGFLDDKKCSHALPSYTNVRYHYLPLPRKIYQGIYSRLFKLPLDMLAPQYDCYVATNFTLFPYLRRKPALITIHDLAYIDIPETIEPKNLTYLRKRVPESIRASQGVIAVSKFTQKRLPEVFPEVQQSFLIENAIDDVFHAKSSQKHFLQITKKYGLPAHYLLCVGTLEPRKNLTALLRAYQKSGRQESLVIVGKKGWIKDEALTKSISADTLERVIFTGFVDDEDLPVVYARARLFIFPSLYEGFGLPLLEAMASSVPVIASDISPFRDIAGDLIDYFDPNDIFSMQTALITALETPIDMKRCNKAALHAQTFTWHHSAEELKTAILKTLT